MVGRVGMTGEGVERRLMPARTSHANKAHDWHNSSHDPSQKTSPLYLYKRLVETGFKASEL